MPKSNITTNRNCDDVNALCFCGLCVHLFVFDIIIIIIIVTIMELRPEVAEHKGLYLCGQDVFSCGIVGAAFGGLLCASSVLNRNVYMDLIELKKKSAPSIGFSVKDKHA